MKNNTQVIGRSEDSPDIRLIWYDPKQRYIGQQRNRIYPGRLREYPQYVLEARLAVAGIVAGHRIYAICNEQGCPQRKSQRQYYTSVQQLVVGGGGGGG